MSDTENQPYYIAADSETDLIGINAIVPDLICSSFYDLQEREADVLHHAPKKDHVEIFTGMLTTPNVHIITHNGGGFDLGVWSKYAPSLLPLFWDALDEGRIHCTMIREMLLNLATFGSIDNVPVEGVNKQMRYSLAELTMNYLGIDRSAAKEDDDAPRMNYSIVKQLPLSEWPESFIQYAKDDAEDTGRVFLAQAARNQRLIEERGIDAFATEGFRVRVHFALSLMTAQGNRLDPEEVLRVTEEFQTLYNDPRLVEPLIKVGIIVPYAPPRPYANGTQDHAETCWGHKEHPRNREYKKARSASKKNGAGTVICNCPPKTTNAEPQHGSDKALHEYVWSLATQPNSLIDAWASDSLLDKLKEAGLKDEVIKGSRRIDVEAVARLITEQSSDGGKDDNGYLPKGWTLSVDKEWRANFAALDPLMELYDERQKIAKIVTSYLPKLYWADGYDQCPPTLPEASDKFEGKVPAKRVHSQFSPLKETGRCSSRAASKGRGKDELLLYPSWNGQQVDPRVRGCVIPDEGNVLFSIDYSAMELGTAAQACIDLFGHSVLGDKINAGVDTHAYLGAQIAKALDPYFAGACPNDDVDDVFDCFSQTKGFDEPCDSEAFKAIKGDDATWSDFFKHYRKFAKPTGLGYPGGLGPKTFIAYAKGTYGVTVNLETAELLRDVWRSTYPELPRFLDYINKNCEDPFCEPDYQEDENGNYKKRNWYAYTSPLGMHRARCAYTACANGKALQTPSAEGALGANADIMRECTIGTLAGKVWPSIFIHDEVFGEMRYDDPVRVTERVEKMMDIMTTNMMRITPDVVSRAEPCLMRRWNKAAEPVWEEVDGLQILQVWEPKKEEE